MNASTLIVVIRLALGVALSAYGLIPGLWLHVTGRIGEGLAHAMLWGLAGCIVAPLAEDVGTMLHRLKQSREKGEKAP